MSSDTKSLFVMNDYSEAKVLPQHTFHLRAVTAPCTPNLSSTNSVHWGKGTGKELSLIWKWSELLEHLKHKGDAQRDGRTRHVELLAWDLSLAAFFCHLFSSLAPQAPLGPATADCTLWKVMRRIFGSLNTEGPIASIISVPYHKNGKRKYEKS